MRQAAALLLAAATAACSRGFADGPACPHEGVPDRAGVIAVRHTPLQAVLRRDLSLPQITAIGLGGGRPQGLTVVDHSYEHKWKRTISSSRKPGRMCVWLTSFTLDLTPSKVEIFVPRDYPDGSCEGGEVLRHEREHEYAHKVSLDEFSARLSAAFAAADWLPVEGAPLEVADEAEADRRLSAAFMKVFEPERGVFLEELAKRNAILDLPANYQWVTSRCSGWK